MKRIGECYICRGTDPDTRDHVIPECFFADPKPKDLLTFPAHRACDAHLILSDEYARNIPAGLRSETAKSFALSSGRPKKRLGNVAVAADEQ